MGGRTWKYWPASGPVFCQCATIFCSLWQKSSPLYPNGSESSVWLTSTMSVLEGRPFYVHLRTNSASTMCSHLSIFDPCIAFKSNFVRNGLSVPHPLLSVLLIRLICDQVVSKRGRPQEVHFGQLYPCVHSTWNHVQNLSSVLHTLLSVVLIVYLKSNCVNGGAHRRMVESTAN